MKLAKKEYQELLRATAMLTPTGGLAPVPAAMVRWLRLPRHRAR